MSIWKHGFALTTTEARGATSVTRWCRAEKLSVNCRMLLPITFNRQCDVLKNEGKNLLHIILYSQNEVSVKGAADGSIFPTPHYAAQDTNGHLIL